MAFAKYSLIAFRTCIKAMNQHSANIRQTPSKAAFEPPQGLDALNEVCRSVSIPVFAVGGITPEKALACIENGAYGIAALGPFIDPESLPGTINSFKSFISS